MDPDIDLTLSSTDALAPVTRGEKATFRIVVTNTTSATVTGVRFYPAGSSDDTTRFDSATCSAEGGATCPEYLGSPSGGPWSSPSMPPGSSLTFDMTVAVKYFAGTSIENEFWIDADNRIGARSVLGHGSVVADARSGEYRMYSASGGLETAALDFMGDTFTTGAGRQAFTGIDSFDLPGNGIFTAAPDLLIGNLDAGSGGVPFVAARRFVATVAALDGRTFSVFSREQVAGQWQTSVHAASVAGGVLTTCIDAVPYAAADCPAASQHRHTLTVADGVFTGLDAAHGETLTFQVAMSQSAMVFLRAGSDASFTGLQVGVLVNDGPGENSGFAVDSRGNWGWLELRGGRYSVDWTTPGGGVSSDSAAVAPITGADHGLVQGQRASDGATIQFSVNTPLGVVIGAPGGAASGELQLIVPLIDYYAE